MASAFCLLAPPGPQPAQTMAANRRRCFLTLCPRQVSYFADDNGGGGQRKKRHCRWRAHVVPQRTSVACASRSPDVSKCASLQRARCATNSARGTHSRDDPGLLSSAMGTSTAYG